MLKLYKKKIPNYETQYKPMYTNYTDEIIKDTRECLKTINEDQVTIDTLDLCHYIGKIDNLESRIEEVIDYIFNIIHKDLKVTFEELRQITYILRRDDYLDGGETMACGRKKGGKKR